MTKKDGDKLRAIQDEILAMARQYEQNSTTASGMVRSVVALEMTLRGLDFKVTGTRHEHAILERIEEMLHATGN